MLSIQKKISPYNFNNTNNIKFLVIHDVGAFGTAKNNADYFYGGNRGASAHYFVDDDSIWQVVEDYRGAWHCGDNNGYGRFPFGITNSNSLSIEMCLPSGDITVTTEKNTLELAKYLMNKYNIPIDNVVRHYDATRKSCPAQFKANNWARWTAFKSKLYDAPIPTPIIPEVNKVQVAADYVGAQCKELQTKLIALGYNCGGYGADGKFGQGTYDSLIKFQKEHGLVADGLAGANTFAKLNSLICPPKPDVSGDEWTKRLQNECNIQGFSSQKVDGFPGPITLLGCPMIKEGSKGDITKLLQERLISLGYSCGSYGADGKFGSSTTSAVKKYQQANGLTADGIVGENTWRKLLNM